MKKSIIFISTLLAAGTLGAFAADWPASNSVTDVETSETYTEITIGTDDTAATGSYVFKVAQSGNNRDLTIGTLSIANAGSSLTIKENVCDFISITNLSGAGTLTLSKNSTNGWGGGMVLGNSSTTSIGLFTGTIKIWNGDSATSGSNYSQVLFIQNENIASGATISLGSYSTLALATDTDTVKIAGLTGNSNATVISYAVPSGNLYDATTSYSTNEATVRTLDITGSGTYGYAGNIGSATNASAVKLTLSGAGTQKLSGTNYIGGLTIGSNATLNLMGGTTTISFTNTEGTNVTHSYKDFVTNSGTLNIGENATLALDVTLGTSGYSHANATLNATGTGTIIATNIVTAADSNGSHNLTISVGSKFAGTVKWIGNLDPTGLTGIDNIEKLVLSQYSSKGSLWSTAGATFAAKTIIDGTYNVGAGQTYEFSKGLIGQNSGTLDLTAANAKVTVSGGELSDIKIKESGSSTSLNITGAVSLTGTVDLKEASTVSVDLGATLTIAGTLAVAHTITNSGEVVVSSASYFDLASTMGSTSGDATTYTIFSSGGTITGWSDLLANKENFTIDGEALSTRQSISLSSADGTVEITGAALNLYWTAESGTWETDNWAEGSTVGTAATFVRSDNAYFTKTAAVTVGTAGTHAHTIEVSGTGTVLSLTGISNLSWVSAKIDTGATLKITETLSGNNTFENISGAGTLQVTMNGDEDSWNHNVILSNSTFTGTLEVLGGHYTLTSNTSGVENSNIGSGKYLFNGADVEAAKSATISNEIEFKKDALFYANTGVTITLSGDVTVDSSATVTKKGAGTIAITKDSSIDSLTNWTVDVGTLLLGANNFTLTEDKTYGSSADITVNKGATLELALSKSDTREFAGAITLKDGATLKKFDGSHKLSGTVTLGDSASASVTVTGNWGKGGLDFAGTLKGAGTTYLTSSGNMDSGSSTEKFTISGNASDFAGTLVVGQNSEGTNSSQKVTLIVSSSDLSNASVNLATKTNSVLEVATANLSLKSITSVGEITKSSSLDSAKLTITGNSSISGTVDSAVAIDIVSGTTTVSGTGIAGAVTVKKDATLSLSAATTLSSLTSAGLISSTASDQTTLTLTGDSSISGDIASGTTVAVSSGTTTISGQHSSGTGGLVSVASGATLNIATGTTTVAAITFSSTDAKFTIDLTDAVADESGAISIITAASITYLMDAIDVDTFFDATNSELAGYDLNNYDWIVTAKSISLKAIPEPSTFGLLAGTLALALAGTSRRRRRGNAKRVKS